MTQALSPTANSSQCRASRQLTGGGRVLRRAPLRHGSRAIFAAHAAYQPSPMAQALLFRRAIRHACVELAGRCGPTRCAAIILDAAR